MYKLIKHAIGLILLAGFTVSFFAYTFQNLGEKLTFAAGPLLIIIAGFLCLLVHPSALLKETHRIICFVVMLALSATVGFFLNVADDPSLGSNALTFTLLSATLVCCSLIHRTIGIEKVIQLYYVSGIVANFYLTYLVLTHSPQVDENVSRNIHEGMHPNLVGFLSVSYAAAALSQLSTKRIMVRLIAFITVILSAYVIVQVSSRASVVALIVGVGLCTLAHVKSSIKAGRYLPAAGTVLLVSVGAYIGATSEYLAQKLEVFSAYRGIDSGFTGRGDTWRYLIEKVPFEWYIHGIGFRASNALVEAVDNSFIVTLLEQGIVGFILILFTLLYAVFFALRNWNTQPGLRSVAYIVVVALVNCIFARYLFGVGNPYSVLLLFMISLGCDQLMRVTKRE